MADTTQGLTKRLDFGSDLGSVQQTVDQEALIAALRHPTVDGFNRALDLLQSAAHQRFAAVQDSAAEQAEAVGEADLRRLKRQFSSLKNTFLHYEVKNEFLAELLDGRPHGDEGELLHHFEAEVEASVVQLRQLKQANEEAEEGISELVAGAAAAHDAFERQRVAVAGELARLQQQVAQHERDVEAQQAALPELPEGPAEQECQAALAAATEEVRELEAAIAAGMAEAQELSTAIAEEREESEALRAQLGDLESQNAQQGDKVEANARFLSTSQWCDEAASTLTLLGGLSLLHISRDAVHLKLGTAYPVGAVSGPDPGPCATGDHELSLHLQPGGGSVSSAQLTPADVCIDDIVEAAREVAAHSVNGSGPRLDFVVREVQACLGAWLHRQALVEEVRQAGRFIVLLHSADCRSLKAKLSQAVEVEVRLVASWPGSVDVVQVAGISGAEGSKAETAGQLRFEGRGLLQALEAVERELA